jgi:hypothetical protein
LGQQFVLAEQHLLDGLISFVVLNILVILGSIFVTTFTTTGTILVGEITGPTLVHAGNKANPNPIIPIFIALIIFSPFANYILLIAFYYTKFFRRQKIFFLE